MVTTEPIRVELEKEDGGRILASVPDLPGVMAYGASEGEAIRKVKAIALQALADMVESGEEVPEPPRVLLAGPTSHFASMTAKSLAPGRWQKSPRRPACGRKTSD